MICIAEILRYILFSFLKDELKDTVWSNSHELPRLVVVRKQRQLQESPNN